MGSAPRLSVIQHDPACRVQDVTLTQCVYFKIDPFGTSVDSSSFANHAADVVEWANGNFGEATPRISAVDLAERLARQGGEPSWAEILFPKTADAAGKVMYWVAVHCWHDTACWVVVMIRKLGGQRLTTDESSLKAEIGSLLAMRWQPPIDVPDEFIGQSAFVRVVTHGALDQETRKHIGEWGLQALKSATPNSEAPGHYRQLHDSLLSDHADCFVLLPYQTARANGPYDPSGDTWWWLQRCDERDDAELDRLTQNELRRLEGFAHKMARLEADYLSKVREFLEREQQELDVETGFWVSEFARSGPRGKQLETRLQEALNDYLRLSKTASDARKEQVSLRVNLENLDRRRAELERVDMDEIYSYHSSRGHRVESQIAGDLDYLESMLRQTEATLQFSDARLQLQRQALDVRGTRIFTSLLFALSAMQAWGLFLTVHGLNGSGTFWTWPSTREFWLDAVIVLTFVVFFLLALGLWALFEVLFRGAREQSASVDQEGRRGGSRD